MTKPQIWVASFLALFLVLFLLGRLTKEDESGEMINREESPVPQTSISSEDMSAGDLINRLGCITCHGADLRGTRMGPTLYGVNNYWGREKLISYLRNPSSYSDTERFKEQQKKFQGVMMPSFNNIDVKELGKIADYLLQLE